MAKIIKDFILDESGAALIEYTLIAALIGTAAILGLTAVGNSAEAKLQSVATSMGGAP